MGLFDMFTQEIAIDLGTANTLIIHNNKIVIDQPSIVAIERSSGKAIAVGEQAKHMQGKTHEDIKTIRPLKDGVIADFAASEHMIKEFIKQIPGIKGKLIQPSLRIVICIPSGITEVEKRAVRDSAQKVNAKEVRLIYEPMAAAIGVGIDVQKPEGNMIIDIGGGTTEIAVVALGGIVCDKSVKIAGDDFDEAIVRYMRKKHNLLIGERTAEDIKIKIGTTYPLVEEEKMEVRGRNLVTGLPKTVTVTSSETEEALRESTGQIVEAVIGVLEQTPPELSADILDRGIVLTGGGSLLRGLEELIEERTGINTMTAEDPMKVVAIGTGQFVEFMSGRKEF